MKQVRRSEVPGVRSQARTRRRLKYKGSKKKSSSSAGEHRAILKILTEEELNSRTEWVECDKKVGGGSETACYRQSKSGLKVTREKEKLGTKDLWTKSAALKIAKSWTDGQYGRYYPGRRTAQCRT